MDKNKSPVNGQIENNSPWADKRCKSMERQEILDHGQAGDTSPWTDKGHLSINRQKIVVH